MARPPKDAMTWAEFLTDVLDLPGEAKTPEISAESGVAPGTLRRWKRKNAVPHDWENVAEIGRYITPEKGDGDSLPEPRGARVTDMPMYVREALNIPSRYWEELSERRLALMVEALRCAGKEAEPAPRRKPPPKKGNNVGGVMPSEPQGTRGGS